MNFTYSFPAAEVQYDCTFVNYKPLKKENGQKISHIIGNCFCCEKNCQLPSRRRRVIILCAL